MEQLMKIRTGILLAGLVMLSGCEKSVEEARMECLSEASNAPTDAGVKQRVMLCHQKFPKKPVDWSQFTPTGERTDEDAQYGFSVTRPTAWYLQERPSSEVRFMFGIEGDEYGGNCNVVVLPSPSTTTASQENVDKSENQRPLSPSFFESELRRSGVDATVISVRQTKRGPHYGHLVDYVHTSFSTRLNTQLHFRGELFSHSRPGRVYSFTCGTAATTSDAAQRGFVKELRTFERLSASLRTL